MPHMTGAIAKIENPRWAMKRGWSKRLTAQDSGEKVEILGIRYLERPERKRIDVPMELKNGRNRIWGF